MNHPAQIILNPKAFPIVMGIINLTPDSFYDGGRYTTTKAALQQVEKHIADGAAIIDMGAYSSRPNAVHISGKEEGDRLFPMLQAVLKEFPQTLISIDTFRSEIARESIAMGAHIINDISGGNMDATMFQTIAKLKVPYILMHMQGTPQNMQKKPIQTNVTHQVRMFFQKKLEELQKLGVNDVILDVGFGFGKSLDQNYELLKNLPAFKSFDKPVLVGISRKSMLYKVLQKRPDQALNATSVAHTIALLNGADILRVHDVKEAVEVIQIINQYQKI